MCLQLRMADYTRGQNRALIDACFNGAPPYTEQEVAENNININKNDLSGTKLAHDARAQMSNAFLKSGVYFNCKTDSGPKHLRDKYNRIVTTEMARMMKRNLQYYECMRSKFALLILHGIGPAVWEDKYHWCPDPRGIEDLLIPSNTKLSFKGLPFFVFLKSFYAPELIRMTRGSHVDPAWNKDLVERAIKYIDDEAMSLVKDNFPDIWSPEKQQERIKSSGMMYYGDSVPTLDCYDFYYWSDEGGNEGWRRRIVIDDWSSVTPNSKRPDFQRNPKLEFSKGEWLYNSEDRIYADKREQIFSCQFADLSAVAPFQYHSVRSLGFLMYSICQVQNRLRCKFDEAVFEALTMLFRVKTKDDAQRALKLQLINQGFIDDSISPVPAAERWQVNSNLVQLGLQENKELIQDNSSSYTSNTNNSQGGVEKTRYQVMAEVNAVSSLVSSGISQAYQYQNFENAEIKRRFMQKDSRDPDVMIFRGNCLRQGVPEKVLVAEAWDTEPEQVFGGGNLTRETAIAEWLMQNYDKYEPESQRLILRKASFAVTGDPGLSDTLVPEKPQISTSVHDTELAFGTLMQGIPVQPSSGLNASEVAGTVIRLMSQKVSQVMQSGGVGTPQDLIGLQLAAQYAGSYLQILDQDKGQKAVVKQLGDALGKVMNMIKGMAQRQQEMAKKAAEAQQNGNGQLDPKDKAKVAGMMVQAQTKAQIAKQSAATRTAQKQIQFEQKLKQDQQKHQTELAKKDLEAASNIRRKRMTSTEE